MERHKEFKGSAESIKKNIRKNGQLFRAEIKDPSHNFA